MGKGRPTATGVEPLKRSIRIRFTADGKRQSLTVALPPTASNVAAAVKLRQKIVAEIDAGIFDIRRYMPDETGDGRPPLFRDYAEDWLGTLTNSKSTKVLYRSALTSLWVPELGDKRVNQIAHSDVKRARANGLQRGLAPSTLNVYLSVLTSVFEDLVADNVVGADPTARLKRLKVQREPPDPFSAGEMEQIVAWLYARAPEQVANYFEFAFCTGMRPSELIALTWDDVDWQAAKLRIRAARVRAELKSTKTYKERLVDLNDRTLATLRRQKAHTYMQGLRGVVIFQNPATGARWADSDTLRDDHFSPALRHTGIRHRPSYNTRHTYATIAIMGGVPIAYVSKQLGHATMETTIRSYFWWIESADGGAAAAQTNQLFGQPLATTPSKLLET